MAAQETLFGIVDRSEAVAAKLRMDREAYEMRVVRTFALREGEPGGPDALLNRADVVAEFWRAWIETATWYDPDKECFVVFILSRRNRLIAYNLVSLGTLTAALAHPREIYRPVIVAAGAACICAHSHPSGDPSPSSADIQLTRQITEAGRAIDIPCLDHIVIGRRSVDALCRGYYSFREAGLI
jgi:DNA repair protein RadC